MLLTFLVDKLRGEKIFLSYLLDLLRLLDSPTAIRAGWFGLMSQAGRPLNLVGFLFFAYKIFGWWQEAKPSKVLERFGKLGFTYLGAMEASGAYRASMATLALITCLMHLDRQAASGGIASLTRFIACLLAFIAGASWLSVTLRANLWLNCLLPQPTSEGEGIAVSYFKTSLISNYFVTLVGGTLGEVIAWMPYALLRGDGKDGLGERLALGEWPVLWKLGFASASAYYLLRAAYLAKAADVVADRREMDEARDPNLEEMDKAFDLLADGTFTKLILINLINMAVAEAWPLALGSEAAEGSQTPEAFALSPTAAWLLAYASTHLLSGAITSVGPEGLGSRLGLCLSLLSWLVDPQCTLLGAALIFISYQGLSLAFSRSLSRFLQSDMGSVGNVPLLGAGLASLPLALSVSGGSFGVPSLALMAWVDQIGYLADIFEETTGELGLEMDVLGNQAKGAFKQCCALYFSFVLADAQLSLPYLGARSFAASVGLAALSVMDFYRFLSSLLSLPRANSLEEAVDSASRTFDAPASVAARLLVAAAAYQAQPVYLAPTILSGAINDNVKKVTLELKTSGKVSPSLTQRVKMADLEGDYKKDVLFPAVIAKALLFLPGEYLSQAHALVSEFIQTALVSLRSEGRA